MPRSPLFPLVVALVGCVGHPTVVPPHQQLQESLQYFPQSVEKDIDPGGSAPLVAAD